MWCKAASVCTIHCNRTAIAGNTGRKGGMHCVKCAGLAYLTASNNLQTIFYSVNFPIALHLLVHGANDWTMCWVVVMAVML